MKAECEWERFTRTGRVEDYLTFKAKEDAPEQRERPEEDPHGYLRAGERIYAGFRDRDGNGN